MKENTDEVENLSFINNSLADSNKQTSFISKNDNSINFKIQLK
jgi:hypothetical protein